jgi:hypothetical protein
MPQIVNDSFCPALVRCFSGLEFRNINSFIAIFSARVCAVSKHFMDRLAVIGPIYSEKQRDLSLLFRCSEFEKPRKSAAFGDPAAVFSME